MSCNLGGAGHFHVGQWSGLLGARSSIKEIIIICGTRLAEGRFIVGNMIINSVFVRGNGGWAIGSILGT